MADNTPQIFEGTSAARATRVMWSRTAVDLLFLLLFLHPSSQPQRGGHRQAGRVHLMCSR